LDDITEELKHYEESRMDEAVQTSREVLEVLYSVLKKVREKGME
jgi:flagellar motor component MotA